jgi:hypothetical protein
MQATPLRFKVRNRDGYVDCELYQGSSNKAVIYMHGVGGGKHGPSDIYHPLAEELAGSGISSLLIDCRYDSDLEECISDVLACVGYLDEQYGVSITGLIGWSFGGAVAISVAARDPRVRTVVTVASQSYGTRDVHRIAPRPILLIHGKQDRALPYDCSVDIYRRARDPRKLVLYEGADHGISQARKEMYDIILEWFKKNL